MEAGDIRCIKITGELVMSLGKVYDDGTVGVRRPVVGREGITHVNECFYPFELETEEEHLKREAGAMILKVKIQKELDLELRKMDAEDEEEKHDPLVN